MTFPDRRPVWAELDELLSRPEYDPDLSGLHATYRRAQSFARALGPASKLVDDPARLLAGMEWAGTVDPAMMHVAMVHYAAATTIHETATPNPDLDRLLPYLDDMEAPGVLVATELGRGGSQVSMRTEARWNPHSDSFTLTTPDDDALKIMPNVGWRGLDRIAVVNARLLDAGQDRGIHAFAVRLPHPGVDIAPLPGSAPLALDYATIRFNDAVIPRGWWLPDDAHPQPGGTIHDPQPAMRRAARSLYGVQTALTSGTVALAAAARAATATAARFQTQRLIGPDSTPAADLSPHRADLARIIARTYAASVFVDHVAHGFTQPEPADADSDAVETASYAPWVAAHRDRTLAKVAASTTLEHVAATARRLCGFHGVLHTNRIAVYEDMARSFHSAGGDNRLLLLEVGKQLATTPSTVPAVSGPLGAAMGDPHTAYRLTCLRERILRDELAHQLQHHNPASIPEWNPHLPALEELGRAHLTRRVLETFNEATDTTGRHADLLATVHYLYGLELVIDGLDPARDRTADWHLNFGSLRPGELDTLHYARRHAIDHVMDHLTGLVEGLAVPPGRAGGFIGRNNYVQRIAALLP